MRGPPPDAAAGGSDATGVDLATLLLDAASGSRVGWRTARRLAADPEEYL
ncbi:hypothetical protein [Blastococcus goldschmidtiae]|uniref:Uncharacterized protein n=1 Tax=Blastococcus goldschmidtiae TaxID=3075546 RepID=A0ABU2KD30_9ACTN|nr:hypothetical protein [Blastococcus sp. DSM 46792]MDT0278100.1 hypothetical protein [Blastococcus sp. DSM 46792]